MSDKKLTDEEIIKVLECCAYNDGCERCQYSKQCDGAEHLINTLDLINRQKAENEMLKKKISDKKHALFEQQEYTAELQQTLETKCDDCDNIRLSRPEYWKAIKAAKAEAYKEFAERLKEKIWDVDCRVGYVQVVDMGDIDETLKEMVGKK